jgi:hypothetical protein
MKDKGNQPPTFLELDLHALRAQVKGCTRICLPKNKKKLRNQ